MNTTDIRTNHQRGALANALIGLLALIAVLVLAVSLAPAASAETPAQRCQRETAAYNNAWKAVGQKPPAPYRCGSNNAPPPTLSPTTPEDTPDTTVAPDTTTPKTNDLGPGMNPPTERREIEHPGTEQAPIGGKKTVPSKRMDPVPAAANKREPRRELPGKLSEENLRKNVSGPAQMQSGNSGQGPVRGGKCINDNPYAPGPGGSLNRVTVGSLVDIGFTTAEVGPLFGNQYKTYDNRNLDNRIIEAEQWKSKLPPTKTGVITDVMCLDGNPVMAWDYDGWNRSIGTFRGVMAACSQLYRCSVFSFDSWKYCPKSCQGVYFSRVQKYDTNGPINIFPAKI